MAGVGFFGHLKKLIAGKFFGHRFCYNGYGRQSHTHDGAAVKRSGTERAASPLVGCSRGLGISPTSRF